MLFSDRNWRCDNQMTTSLSGRQINPNRCEPARLGSSTLHEPQQSDESGSNA
jgi:hypothetical protein